MLVELSGTRGNRLISLVEAVVCVATFLLAVTRLGQATQAESPEKVSADRAKFGDPVRGTKPWTYNQTGEVEPTIILYPEGSSGARYYLTHMPLTFGISVSPWYLVKESKSSVSAAVKMDWAVLLRPAQATSTHAGTLAQIISSYGLEVAGQVDVAKSRGSLTAKKGFAAYQLSLEAGILKYWFVPAEGSPTKKLGFGIDGVDLAAFPRAPFPYPMTLEERQKMKS